MFAAVLATKSRLIYTRTTHKLGRLPDGELDSGRVNLGHQFLIGGFMNSKTPGAPQVTPHEREEMGSRRDPEERPAVHAHEVRDKMLDKTLADSFPTSDPPSSIPDPASEESISARKNLEEELIAALPHGSWAAISMEDRQVVGTGASREEAEEKANAQGYKNLSLVRVPPDPDAPEQAA